jgi:hypothetical protein
VLIEDPVKMDGDPNILVDGKRVLVFSTRVFVPNQINKSWTMMIRSEDDGQTWSKPTEIPIPRQYIAGKQHNGIKLRDGTYMFGIAWDKWPEMGLSARTEGEMDLTAGVMLSKDAVRWTLHGAVHTFVEKLTPGGTNGLCEPSLVELENGEVLMILRSGDTFHYESRSRDGGLTWSAPVRSSLPGHNTPTAKTEGLQVSYPGITQAADGTFVAVWQQALPDGGRDVRWARFTREWVLQK